MMPTSTRFVSLTDRHGRRLCAALPITIERRVHPPTDLEFEEAALKAAIRDGLIASRRDASAAVGTPPHHST